MMRIGFVLVVLTLAVLPAQGFNPDEWSLVFEDTFDRQELGDDWIVPGSYEIIGGRLLFGCDGNAIAALARPHAADVRVEFDAEAWEGDSPCDLSVGLCGPRNAYRYLLAFGGAANTRHHIMGGGKSAGARWENPPKLIEHGKVYHIAATKEGQRLTLEVDRELLLSATDEDPLGGKGFDCASAVTWHGMYLDNVKVYERREPHPDSPVALALSDGAPLTLTDARQLLAVRETADPAVQDGIRLFNEGRPAEAEKAFEEAADPETRVLGIAYCIGHVYYEENRADWVRLGALMQALAASDPGDEQLHRYEVLGQRAGNMSLLRGEGLPNGELASDRIISMGFENNPLYDKATYHKARFMRAHSMEGGGRNRQEVAARLRALKELYPDEPSLRELTGERLPWGDDLINDSTGTAPAWARYLRELYARQCRVLNWWFTERQLPDGQLGGGWGDDVEILRDWGPLATISTGDPAIVAGIERLCEGIWQSRLDRWGFDSFGDVEHSSEPSADTVPTIMLLKWGDPLWVERDMRSCKTIRDYYMGVDDKGYYRFKSAFFGDNRVGNNDSQKADNLYCTRPMKHFQHLALWGNPEARRVYLNWVDGWLAQTMAEYPGKPAGFIPASLYYPDGGIIPPGRKSHIAPGAHFLNTFPEIGNMMQDAFMAGYFMTGNPEYLEPMYIYLMNTSYGPLLRSPTDELEVGSLDWCIAGQQGTCHRDTLAEFRWLTGDETVDEYILRTGSSFQKFYVTDDFEHLIRSIEGSARRLRYNFRLMTKEELQTDRAGLPGIHESFGAYTGALHIWRESLLPTMAVTWDTPDTNFAGLVKFCSDKRLRVWVYNFNAEPMRVGLKLWWRLRPGVYSAQHGKILPGEGENLRYRWSEPENFSFRRPLDTYYVEVPPRTPYCIDLRLEKPLLVPPTAPDPAVADRDLRVDEQGNLVLTVHNIGNQPFEGLICRLEQQAGDAWQAVRELRTGTLVAPSLDPVRQDLDFGPPASPGAWRVVLDPDNSLDELYEGNNIARLGVQ